MENVSTNISRRLEGVRFRTWIITLALVVALVFYVLVRVVFGEEFAVVDFVIMCVLQTVAHCTYYPDGAIFGTTDKRFVSNKQAYNEKATAINEKRQVALLREYTQVEYEERKKRWIEAECGTCGITIEEYEELKKHTKKEVKALIRKKWEFGGRIFVFSGHKKKHLIKLLFKKIPIEKNEAETILSAVDKDGFARLKDTSTKYNVSQYALRFFKTFVWGTFMAYTAYKAKDGINISDIARLVSFLGTILVTAILSYSGGEKSTKVYKCQFYIDLSNYIDGFNEWVEKKS